MTESGWKIPGGSLSEKSAVAEYGLTTEEIRAQIKSGKLQYREQSAHGNPYLKLLRHEIEQYLNKTYGAGENRRRKMATELKVVNQQLRKNKKEFARLTVLKGALEEKIAEVHHGA